MDTLSSNLFFFGPQRGYSVMSDTDTHYLTACVTSAFNLSKPIPEMQEVAATTYCCIMSLRQA